MGTPPAADPVRWFGLSQVPGGEPTHWLFTSGAVTWTETSFQWHGGFEEMPGEFREQIQEWLAFHGIDGNQVWLHSVVTRDLDRRAVIVSDYLVTDEEGRRMPDPSHPSKVANEVRVSQGETEPLPWPFTVGEMTDTCDRTP